MRLAALGLGAAALVALALPAAGATAGKPPQAVSIEFAAYGPSQLDVLPGDTVLWTNESQRTHTVTSDTGLYDSGHIGPSQRFDFTFNTPGIYLYHCTIHTSITGEIDVRGVTLGQLPTAAVPLGDKVEFDGRTADPSRPVQIQRSTDGSHFTTVATAHASSDGNWTTMVTALETGEYRAASGASTSESRRMLVGIRHVLVHPTASGVSVTVDPSAPYAPLLVEEYLRERFGWWPVKRARLDYISDAEIRIQRPARVRIVLVDTDGWTPIATSRPLTLPKR
jgi:plastocyanin